MEACGLRLSGAKYLSGSLGKLSNGLPQLQNSPSLALTPHHSRNSSPVPSPRKPKGINSILAREPASQPGRQANPVLWTQSPLQEAARPSLEQVTESPASWAEEDSVLKRRSQIAEEATAALEQVLQLPGVGLPTKSVLRPPITTEEYVEVFHGETKLRVDRDGSIELYKTKEGREMFVASGRVRLPEDSMSSPEFSKIEVLSDGRVEVRWGRVGVLRVAPVGADVATPANLEVSWAAVRGGAPGPAF